MNLYNQIDNIRELLEEIRIDMPKTLYHATYKKYVSNIMVYGLTPGINKNCIDSEDCVYLSNNPESAKESIKYNDATYVDSDIRNNIVLYKIQTSTLDSKKLSYNPNLDCNGKDTVFYYDGTIPFFNLQKVEDEISPLVESKIDNIFAEKYKKWKLLVNMSPSELTKFRDKQLDLAKKDKSQYPGLKKKEADELNISSGMESCEWILKMKHTNVSDWTPTMWKWCNKQISFISRMSKNKGVLIDENGEPTRKLLSLKIWGHDPIKNHK